jgi:hypothetical protein
MKTFESILHDAKQLARELVELEGFLKKERKLREREHVIPFFKKAKHLSAALGYLTPDIHLAERVANELDLFGDFICDAASGDSKSHAYTLIEFEDANEYTISRKPSPTNPCADGLAASSMASPSWWTGRGGSPTRAASRQRIREYSESPTLQSTFC